MAKVKIIVVGDLGEKMIKALKNKKVDIELVLKSNDQEDLLNMNVIQSVIVLKKKSK